MPLFDEVPWSTWPVTVIVPDTVPLVDCGEMFALVAVLKPLKPSVMALSTEASRPRYAFCASAVEFTPLPHPATKRTTRKTEVRVMAASLGPGAGASVNGPRPATRPGRERHYLGTGPDARCGTRRRLLTSTHRSFQSGVLDLSSRFDGTATGTPDVLRSTN